MIYKVSKKEKAVVIMVIFMAIIIISILFYGTIYAVVILLPLGVPIYREQKRRIINKKKKQIKCPIDNIKQIKYTRITFINFLLAYFSTGYSPGWFQISFKNRVGRIYGYGFFVKYSDLKKLPKEFLEKVTIQ